MLGAHSLLPPEELDAGALSLIGHSRGGGIAILKAREDRYQIAFADITSLRVALDQELADFDAPLDGVREVAFFPPMTGG